MYRKIGEVAELLGITPSAIRKYEEKGILKSKRQTGNDYRQYDVHDIAKFIRARMYKNMGYSLSDAVDILNSTRIEDYPQIIEKQKEKLAQEILYRQKLLEIMNEWQREIAEVDAPIRIEYSPAVYFFKYFSDLKLISDREQIKVASAALSSVPISYPGFCLETEQILRKDIYSWSVGAYIRAEDVQYTDIRDVEKGRYFPPRMCVVGCIKSFRNTPVCPESMEEILSYMMERGMQPTGPMITKFILSDYEKEDYEIHTKVWIPFD